MKKFSKQETQALMSAAQRGDLARVQNAIEDGFPIDKTDGKNLTLLVEAVESERSEVALWLLEHGANPNAKRSPKAWSLVHSAATYSMHDVLETLLEAGCDPNDQINKYQWTPLHLAGSARAIELLVKFGAELNPIDKQGRSPFGFYETAEQVIALRNAGADWAPDAKPRVFMRYDPQNLLRIVERTDYPVDSTTFDEIAGWPGTEKLVAYFLERGATPSEVGIEKMIVNERIEDLQWLKSYGVDLGEPRGSDRVKAIIAGDDVPEIDPHQEFNRLFEQGEYDRAAELVEKLTDLDKPAKTANHRDPMPLLCHAVCFRAKPVVKRLLECGADPNVKCRKSWYHEQAPLHFAMRQGDWDIVDLLVSYGADIRQKSSNGSAPWQGAGRANVLTRFPELQKDYRELMGIEWRE